MSRLHSMSRFEEPNEEEPKVIGCCDHCGTEITEQDEYWDMEGYWYCEDDCLIAWTGATKMNEY